ncbi:NIF3-like protein 1 [Xenopus tropicalis]|uniref:NIF3-like protein 1 n=1 Tax=Xenopus tropicalis TaxID=8364 RepID=Q28GN0_XENTR|nr:NIF3-like protein 1 [Xenopus tropicalis]CAJ82035.1 NIF3 NGG1 interacting factor 3-like 1 (S. pombe) [Xenopus tropicalis]|eukprot:NP_001016355.1 NIF3-like protein 1 [Xenopus tropicalis]
MDLGSVVSRLNVLTPPALAEGWDNVGLLVEPSPPHQVHKLLLTNDLTEDVLDEAIDTGANMILSYHPPVFKALKRITQKSWKERLVVKALEKHLAVYSPHTSCDALANGVNDWLARALGPSKSVPLRASTSLTYPGGVGHLLEFRLDPAGNIMSRLNGIQGVSVCTSTARHDGDNGTRVSLSCSQNALVEVLSILSGVPAELYLTGEMSHHDVLDAVAEGRSVVLCEHSNSERGYLQELGGQIRQALEGQVQVVVSQRDRDPLQVV